MSRRNYPIDTFYKVMPDQNGTLCTYKLVAERRKQTWYAIDEGSINRGFGYRRVFYTKNGPPGFSSSHLAMQEWLMKEELEIKRAQGVLDARRKILHEERHKWCIVQSGGVA